MRLLVEVPYFDPEKTPLCKESIDAMDKCGCDWEYRQRYGYGVDAARNRMAAHAVAGGFDYLLMVDADIVVPQDALANLLEHEVDVCMGWYLNRHGGKTGRTTLCKRSHGWEWYGPDELREMRESGTYTLRVKGGGMGCCLVRTSVFERLAFPWFVWRDISFDRKTGKVKSGGEDIEFCIKCEDAGIHIYADTRVECGHMKPLDV